MLLFPSIEKYTNTQLYILKQKPLFVKGFFEILLQFICFSVRESRFLGIFHNAVRGLRAFFIFVGFEPTKMIGEHPSGFSPSPFPLGETLVSPRPLCAFERVCRASRGVRGSAASGRFAPVPRFARSASGGKEPFSEEKGSLNSKKTFVRFACAASQKAPRERGALTLSITAVQPALPFSLPRYQRARPFSKG